MKYLILLVVVAVVGLGAYACNNNPRGCMQLENDLKARWPTIKEDLVTIYTKSPEPAETAPASAPTGATAASDALPAAPVQHETLPATNMEPDSQSGAYADALGKSKGTGKNMLLIFDGSSWCPSCQELDQQVLSNPGWMEFSEGFITATLEVPKDVPADDSKKTPNQLVASKFAVRGYPTLIVVDPNEKELKRFEGYSSGVGVGPLIETFNPYAR